MAWLRLASWASARLVYTHTLISLWTTGHHTLVTLASLVVLTSVVLTLNLVVASAHGVLAKTKSGTVVLALAWSTANKFTAASINGDRFVLGWLTDLLFWAWGWGKESVDVALNSIKETRLLVALVWKIDKPELVNGLSTAAGTWGTWRWGWSTIAVGGGTCTSGCRGDALPLLTDTVEKSGWWRGFDSGRPWWALWLLWAALWTLYTLSVSAA